MKYLFSFIGLRKREKYFNVLYNGYFFEKIKREKKFQNILKVKNHFLNMSLTDIDLFKYLSVNSQTIYLTSQEYYTCFSRQILKNLLTSRETKFQQITTLRYFSSIKRTDHENVQKLYGEGVLCTAGVWCNRDYTADLILKNGLCHSCFQLLYDKLKKTSWKPLCSFCGIAKGPETCSDCVEMLSTL